MALNDIINLSEDARRPSDVFSIRTQNKDFSTVALESNGATLLEEHFNMFLNDFDSRLFGELYAQRSTNIAETAAFAKNEFDEKLFGGINAADNEIGFDVIRPGHIKAAPSTAANVADNPDPTSGTFIETGATVNTWKIEVVEEYDTTDESTARGSVEVDPEEALVYTETGWNDLIGDGTSSGDYTVDEDQVLLVLGYADLTDPDQNSNAGSEVSGLNVERLGRNVDMLPKDLHDSKIPDNENGLFVQTLPTMVANDRDRVHIRFRADAPGVYEPRLVGVTFGVGSYMNQEDF